MSIKEKIKVLRKGSFIVLTLFLFLPGAVQAQRSYYTPKSLFIPLHNQKKQLHASIGQGGGYQLNLSYTLPNKMVLFHSATMDKGTRFRISVLGDRYNVHRNDYVLKSGLGYFSKVDKELLSVIEAYVGAGLSKIDNYWYYTEGDTGKDFTQAKYWTGFIQFNAGKQVGSHEFGAGLRFAYSRYLDAVFYSGNYSNPSKSGYENLQGFTADPVLSYSFLFKSFKLNGQAGFAFPLTYGSMQRADFHPADAGQTVIRYREQVPLAALIGQVSLQYNLNLGKQP